MIGKTLSLAQIRQAGLEALARELGPVGMVRFLQQFEAGSGDYSADRRTWVGGDDVATFAAAIRRNRARAGESGKETDAEDASGHEL